MLKQFPPPRDYMALSLKDVLDARDAYHVHLSHLSNVVGTAVGRYLIRDDDWYATHTPSEPKPKKFPDPKGPRTLFNTLIKDWSWPCVLVFVNDWLKLKDFHASPDQMVPRAIFLPDGRVVPTCVVFVREGVAEPIAPGKLSFPKSYVGGGYVTLADVQGREHFGSIGCLVTDGDLTYAMTNRHVTGAPGREIFTLLRGRKARIGVSDASQAGCKPFVDMYPGWLGHNVHLNLDAGLVRLDDLAHWTTQVLSMGPMDDILDLNTDSLTLSLIDEKVRAFGGASGELKGRIAALFYRYKSLGGRDYITDFLIRPDSLDAASTKHGDSGTLWFWEQPSANGRPPRLRPFAMQWGGHVLMNEDGTIQRTGTFALASSLSNICRELNVTLVRDWNSGLPEYWGDVGHYTIGFFACDKLSGKIGKLMKANQENVSYPTDTITSRKGIKLRGPDGFVRLADVPDRIWKIPGGKAARGNFENPNHFADMDQQLPDSPNKGKTLLELCDDPVNVDPDVWMNYYTRVKDSEKGLLPFRVWQFFDEMVDAALQQDVKRFVCAAGIVAHYVGDSCQPLHISFLYNGEPMVDADGKKFKRGQGVHEAYETAMLSKHSVELLDLLKTELARDVAGPKSPSSGKQAAVAVVGLMKRTFKAIKPVDIIDAFVQERDLWELFRDQTVAVIADGVRTLAAIWRGAWNKGKGNQMDNSQLVTVQTKALMKLYEDIRFVPSLRLKDIKQVLQ